MDLDSRLEMIIFKSILTTFEASTIFWGSWGSSGNQLKPTNYKIVTKLSFSKSLICTVEIFFSI